MFPWEEYLSGYALQSFLIINADYLAYLSFGYLGMVRYGPAIARRLLGKVPALTVTSKGKIHAKNPAWIQVCIVIWNLLLALFSVCAAMVMVPPLLRTIYTQGLYHTLCVKHNELLYETPVGCWTGFFVLSKILELVDTLLLIVGKRKTPPFLHWYHHASVLLFSWFSYAKGNSTMAAFACMNVCVHAVMYTYFFLCAAGYKSLVRPFAKFITLSQILQMVCGSTLTFYSYVVNTSAYGNGIDELDQLPCAVNRSTARFGCIMYLSYLYLFSKMYADAYLRPVAHEPKSAPECANGAHDDRTAARVSK